MEDRVNGTIRKLRGKLTGRIGNDDSHRALKAELAVEHSLFPENEYR